MAEILITYRTADGEERDEHWPSIERFRLWAKAQGLHCAWSAYEADEDGEFALIDRGRV